LLIYGEGFQLGRDRKEKKRPPCVNRIPPRAAFSEAKGLVEGTGTFVFMCRLARFLLLLLPPVQNFMRNDYLHLILRHVIDEEAGWLVVELCVLACT
jgi:hypothetical protein